MFSFRRATVDIFAIVLLSTINTCANSIKLEPYLGDKKFNFSETVLLRHVRYYIYCVRLVIIINIKRYYIYCVRLVIIIKKNKKKQIVHS